MGEVIGILPGVGFEMTDDGLDGGSSFELALDGLGDASLLSGVVDLELVALGGVVTAIAGIGDDAGETGADLRLGGGDDLGERMTVIGVARQGGDMGDELAALAAINRRRPAHLDAELIEPAGFPLADAFHLGGLERTTEVHTYALQA